MAKSDSNTMIPDEVIKNKIYLFRETKVMLDRDLANLYEIETKQVKHQILEQENRKRVGFKRMDEH